MLTNVAAFIIGVLYLGLVLLGGAAIFAFPIMLLVNYLFTTHVILAVFGVAKISFWQALGLGILSGMLFKSSSKKS